MLRTSHERAPGAGAVGDEGASRRASPQPRRAIEKIPVHGGPPSHPAAATEPVFRRLYLSASWPPTGAPPPLARRARRFGGRVVVARVLLALSSRARKSGETHERLVTENRLLKHLVRELEKRYLKPKGLIAEDTFCDIVEGKPEVHTGALTDAAAVRSRRSILVMS